jgi:hypothetical protein
MFQKGRHEGTGNLLILRNYALPTVALVELLFAVLDSATEARSILNMQNVLIYSTVLDGGSLR